jgi:hypothetical protein
LTKGEVKNITFEHNLMLGESLYVRIKEEVYSPSVLGSRGATCTEVLLPSITASLSIMCICGLQDQTKFSS